jgi:hypothetical protein
MHLGTGDGRMEIYVAVMELAVPFERLINGGGDFRGVDGIRLDCIELIALRTVVGVQRSWLGVHLTQGNRIVKPLGRQPSVIVPDSQRYLLYTDLVIEDVVFCGGGETQSIHGQIGPAQSGPQAQQGFFAVLVADGFFAEVFCFVVLGVDP